MCACQGHWVLVDNVSEGKNKERNSWRFKKSHEYQSESFKLGLYDVILSADDVIEQ